MSTILSYFNMYVMNRYFNYIIYIQIIQVDTHMLKYIQLPNFSSDFNTYCVQKIHVLVNKNIFICPNITHLDTAFLKNTMSE